MPTIHFILNKPERLHKSLKEDVISNGPKYGKLALIRQEEVGPQKGYFADTRVFSKKRHKSKVLRRRG